MNPLSDLWSLISCYPESLNWILQIEGHRGIQLAHFSWICPRFIFLNGVLNRRFQILCDRQCIHIKLSCNIYFHLLWVLIITIKNYICKLFNRSNILCMWLKLWLLQIYNKISINLQRWYLLIHLYMSTFFFASYHCWCNIVASSFCKLVAMSRFSTSLVPSSTIYNYFFLHFTLISTWTLLHVQLPWI